MENDELFVSSSALHAQQLAGKHASSKDRPLQIHTEPLLVTDSDDEPELPRDIDDLDTRPRWRQAHICWLLPFGLLFMLGFGGLAVPKINLIMSLICRDHFAEKALKEPAFTYLPVIFGDDNAQCRTPEISALVAQFQLYLNLITGIVSALVSPRLGQMSDRYGRTTLIALGAMGAVLSEVISCILATWPEKMSINVFLIGALMDGLGGSFTTAQALIHSYATDCTPPEKRSVAFGLFHGILFLGISIGPSGAALIIKKTGSSLLVFYLGVSLHILFCLAIAFIVPESLSKQRQLAARELHHKKQAGTDATRWYSWRSLNPINLFTPLGILLPAVGRPSTLFPNRKGATPALRRNIILLSTLDTVVFSVALGTASVIIIYAELIFNWGNVESSLFISIVNIIRVVNLFVVLPIIARFFRTSVEDDGVIRGSDSLDIFIIRLSIVFDVLGYIVYAMARDPKVMILAGVVTSLGGMGSPTLQSSLTKHVPHERVGQMLGATGLLHALARVVGPTIFNTIYSLTVTTYPQAVFVCLVVAFGCVLFASFFIKSYVTLDHEIEPDLAVEANEDGESEHDQLLVR
ncbi:hypothetical protein N7495_000952 [Penicillium taxi]|uniref:uncharacterized protein n=1 Tax=Penicillium taxi TaxID=168475 RepID=UPI0025457672|nr:uncharacterized protein N7495_000952 [Penicillium taxi]KAJ5908270.1 hypothetical protein N7495_000952 [Penicillium taxi]